MIRVRITLAVFVNRQESISNYARGVLGGEKFHAIACGTVLIRAAVAMNDKDGCTCRGAALRMPKRHGNLKSV